MSVLNEYIELYDKINSKEKEHGDSTKELKEQIAKLQNELRNKDREFSNSIKDLYTNKSDIGDKLVDECEEIFSIIRDHIYSYNHYKMAKLLKIDFDDTSYFDEPNNSKIDFNTPIDFINAINKVTIKVRLNDCEGLSGYCEIPQKYFTTDILKSDDFWNKIYEKYGVSAKEIEINKRNDRIESLQKEIEDIENDEYER